MKTPMQILLEKIENGDFLQHPKVIGEFIKYNLLEKERDHAKYFAFKFRHESYTLKELIFGWLNLELVLSTGI